MTKFIKHYSYQEYYEYHGSTIIERITKQGETISRDWIVFDSVEEASEYFNNDCEL